MDQNVPMDCAPLSVGDRAPLGGSPSPRLRHIHLVAVCGSGMASLAGALSGLGYRVSGSDLAFHPPMGPLLRRLGIELRQGYRPGHLDPPPDLAVIGNAVDRDNPEAGEVLRHHIPFLSFPQAVHRFLLSGRHPVVVAGTHGKSTTSAAVAWTLHAAGMDPGFLVGGVLRNFEASFGTGRGRPFVVEGDEYETAFFDKGPKFLHYAPRTLVITGVEYDHADNFPSLADLRRAFLNLAALLPEDGLLVYQAGDPFLRSLADRCPCRSVGYGLDPAAGVGARDLRASADGTRFRLVVAGREETEAFLPRWGRFNVENALAAAAVALDLGASPGAVIAALAGFQGVKRRQEVVGEARGVLVIDDFAHHPTAVRLTLEAIRQARGDGRLWAILEPRSYTSQTAVFQEEYAAALAEAGRIVLAPLPATTKVPLAERLDLERLARDLRAAGREAWTPASAEEIPGLVASEARAGETVVVMSSGDFGGMPARVLAALSPDYS